MAVYCSKCGTELKENDQFCGKCGAPVLKAGGVQKSSGADAAKYKIIGIAAIAVVVLALGSFVLKGFGGTQKGSQADPGEISAAGSELAEDEDDVLTHLTPWMGEWVKNYLVYPNQGSGLLHNFDNEGQYNGYIFSWENNKGIVRIDEQYIDFSDVTKNQKDRYPVSSLTYYETDYGAEAFEDKDSGIRFIFYQHFHTYDGSEDYGKVMNIQAYVGTEEPEINYMTGTNGEKIPVGFTGHFPGPDGWAVDIVGSFVPLDG